MDRQIDKGSLESDVPPSKFVAPFLCRELRAKADEVNVFKPPRSWSCLLVAAEAVLSQRLLSLRGMHRAAP